MRIEWRTDNPPEEAERFTESEEFVPVGTDNKLTGSHPIMGRLYEITYILGNYYGLEIGWCVIGIKPRGK